MRIFKLARRSVGLQSIAHTVRTSWKDLGLLFSLVAMGMLVFGSLEYFIEHDQEDTGFTSIPQVTNSERALAFSAKNRKKNLQRCLASSIYTKMYRLFLFSSRRSRYLYSIQERIRSFQWRNN